MTLEQVSASTKISVTLLEGLERDDLSRWPTGIYRRSFFRAYLTAVGLSPEPFAGELARLSPDDSSELSAPAPSPAVPEEPLALVLADVSASGALWRRSLLAVLEAAVVIGIGGLAAWAGEMPLLAGGGVVALLYYPFVRAAGQPATMPWSVVAGFGFNRRANSHPQAETVPDAAPSEDTASEGPAHQVQHAVAAAWAPVHHAASSLINAGRPVVAWTATRTGGALARIGGASWRALRSAGLAIAHVIARISVATAAVFRRLGRMVALVSSFVTRHTVRLCVRCLRALNYVLWKGVRAAADRAERVAARQLGEVRSDSAGEPTSEST